MANAPKRDPVHLELDATGKCEQVEHGFIPHDTTEMEKTG